MRRSIIVHLNSYDSNSVVKSKVSQALNRRGKRMAKKWLQAANKKMESKGTKGAFTDMAKKAGGVKKGGGVKDSFIEKELKSSNPTTRKRAQFAKNMKKIAKRQ